VPKSVGDGKVEDDIAERAVGFSASPSASPILPYTSGL